MDEDNVKRSEKPFMEHLEELVFRLRRILLAVFIAAAILSMIPAETQYYVPLITAFPSKVIGAIVPKQISYMGKTYNITLHQMKPYSSFSIILYTAALLGVLGASPIIVREIYAFIEPALYPNEKRLIKRLAGASLGLFALGLAVAYKIIIPMALKIMFILMVAVSPAKIASFSDIEELYSMVLSLLIAVGISFEIPLVIYYLIVGEIVEPERFTGDNMKYAFVVILVVSALLSPDPTGITMLLLAIPYFTLYYTAVKLGIRTLEKKKHGASALGEVSAPSRI